MNEQFSHTSFLSGIHADYLEDLYRSYCENPSSVHPQWQDFFSQISKGHDKSIDFSSFVAENSSKRKLKRNSSFKEGDASDLVNKTERAIAMINHYRTYGHLYAKLDPLGLSSRSPDLAKPSLSSYGFSEEEAKTRIFTSNLCGLQASSPEEIWRILDLAYCSTLCVEFMHIANKQEREWIQSRFEGKNKKGFSSSEKKHILQKLVEAEGFESFIDVKHKGAKRFGLDGGEALIPALDEVLKTGSRLGVEEVVLGMSHRGRLNVLSQIAGKSRSAIFHEFRGGCSLPDDIVISGDVKYHLGSSCDHEFDGNRMHVCMIPNPSHLESVDPVVIGQARARQDRRIRNKKDNTKTSEAIRLKVMPLLLHGDAAFAGQGIVSETLGLLGLSGHTVSGSVHFIINNQIGFTTNPSFSRSYSYPSENIKILGSPIFHVNGDDPEAVVAAARMAVEFRMTFGKPALVDMFCYRRFGHNEGDEPFFTQPVMYKHIRNHKRVSELYAEKLIEEGLISQDDFNQMKADWLKKLETERQISETWKSEKADWLEGEWKGLKPSYISDKEKSNKTAVSLSVLEDIGKRLTQLPPDFQVHKTIERFLENRKNMIKTGEGLDWSIGEALAFGSLLIEGYPVRLSGQDCERGTFSHRHSVLYDQRNEERYAPLNHLSSNQQKYEVINSMLSEEAVLGFEYGYSTIQPHSLVLWEAQFGDFANGAQVIFDQYISSAENKWLRMSGLVCLLPHGYEGQGPEHSSARLERFLQLCAEDNMQVASCTTPANYFHILRRQMKRDFRKPLILMSPKSLLRHRRAHSSLADMSGESSFCPILADDAENSKDRTLVEDVKIKRVILCSGKVYYDILEERELSKINDIYLLRIEQLYPFPSDALSRQLHRFVNAEIVWCQEEPKNMGAWFFVQPLLESILGAIGKTSSRVVYFGRPEAASPAAGLLSKHLDELKKFIDEALGKTQK